MSLKVLEAVINLITKENKNVCTCDKLYKKKSLQVCLSWRIFTGEYSNYVILGPYLEILVKVWAINFPDTVATLVKDDLCTGKFTSAEFEKR